MPTLYTASFYDPQDWVGRRYRVSRSHPRGLSSTWDTLPFCYPSRELLRAYRAGDLDFPALARKYLRGLDAGYTHDGEFQEWVAGLWSQNDFTLLCFERGDRLCHRRVLAEWLQDKVPSLAVGELR